MGRLRNYFLTGIIVSAPVAITAYIAWTLINWVDSWVKPYIPARYIPDTYVGFPVPGFGLVVALLLITLIGFLTANIVGRSVVRWGEGLLHRTPFVRSIYKALKQIFETVLSNRADMFTTAGLIEWPRRGVWAVVFIASDKESGVTRKLEAHHDDFIAVFMPSTPNPTTGFLMYVPKKELIVLDMTVEDAAKLVVSAGLVTPEDLPVKPADQPADSSLIASSRPNR
ncbi:MAG: DUF502 domain-containing protein [Rhizobiaceae bacterium]